MILYNFYKEFIGRHEFDDKELLILKNNYLFTQFINIPVAWITIIDKMLSKFDYTIIKTIMQEYGQLIILYRYTERVGECNKFIQYAEKKIYLLDRDLYEKYGVKNAA